LLTKRKKEIMLELRINLLCIPFFKIISKLSEPSHSEKHLIMIFYIFQCFFFFVFFFLHHIKSKIQHRLSYVCSIYQNECAMKLCISFYYYRPTNLWLRNVDVNVSIKVFYSWRIWFYVVQINRYVLYHSDTFFFTY
jgi:hypothetical protein